MSPEATEAPIDHLKISDAIKRDILVKMIDKNVFTEKTAIKIDELELQGEERYAFDQLVQDDEVVVFEKEGQQYYHLAEHYKYVKSYRKQVVQGFSIPILLFLILLIGAGVVTMIYQFIIWLS